MAAKFGTDGIRGVANSLVTPDLCLALGRAAALTLTGPNRQLLLGRDTRRSGPMLQAALSSGLASMGIDVIDLGVLPTPAIAQASKERNAPAGVVSASHNPFADNGVKFFAAGGLKLTDAAERQMEERISQMLVPSSSASADITGAQVGTVVSDPEAAQNYVAHAIATLGSTKLNGIKVVVDCSHGAASQVAESVLAGAGAQVVVINAAPDGVNINDNCGSTHPQQLQDAVVRNSAQVGLALDGDADRVLAVDETGALVDGDQIMAILAKDMHQRSALKANTLVVTVMSNLGLRLAMQDAGIGIHETKVGDRYVLESLTANGWSLGGEQSGHVIFPDLAVTGDGLVTGLQLLAAMGRAEQPLSQLAAASMQRLPQVLRNVRTAAGQSLFDAPEVWQAVQRVESQLQPKGRVLLRPSGTEPLIRVMVEAEHLEQADQAATELCAVVESSLSRPRS